MAAEAPLPTYAWQPAQPLHTKQIFIDPDDVTRFDAEFEWPVKLIQSGELVAFPTGTF